MNGAIWMMIVFVVTLGIAVPVPIAAGIAALVGIFLADIPLQSMAQSLYAAFEPFPLTTIPLFTLAGLLMEKGGLSNRLIKIAMQMSGAYKGSLGMVTVLACMFFSAISGSGPATTAAIGTATIPAMLKDKYPPSFAAAITAASGALGVMIPPSNMLIIYGLVTDQSIPRLFLAGLIPGIILGFLLIFIVFIFTNIKNYGSKGKPFIFAPLFNAIWEGKWAILAPVVILGGIYGGFLTPSEAAAVAVFYGLFVGVVVYRELTLSKIIESINTTLMLMGAVLFIVGTTKPFGQILPLFDVTDYLTSFFSGLMAPWLVMLIILVLYLFLGMWLESIPHVIIFTPVTLPLVMNLGIDPIVYGVFTVMTCEVGFLTPPMGINLFVASRLSHITVEAISKSVIPFLLPYILVLIIISFYGDWVVFLPNLVFGPRL
jgi:tripartite ATP-independent transporter DctM subunit